MQSFHLQHWNGLSLSSSYIVKVAYHALRVAVVPLIGFLIYRDYDPEETRWHIKRAMDGFKAGAL